MNQTIDSTRDTKERILDTAERLFAQQGFHATSLRQITREAGVNLAAVHYHYQSREHLIEMVLRRKLEPLNARRITLLDGLESALPEITPSLEEVLRAFMLPIFQAQQENLKIGDFAIIMGRLATAPGDWAPAMLRSAFGAAMPRFIEAIRRAVPGLRQEDLAWGMHLTIGAMAHHMAGGILLDMLGGNRVDRHDHQEVLNRLIAFMSAGIRAMASQERHA